jgi:hypothetical protein
MLVAVLVLLALVGTTLLCRRDSWIWPAVLILLCGVWLLVDKPLEGPVLVAVSRGHGITLSDLLAPAGVALAAVLLYRRRVLLRPQPTRSHARPEQPIPNQPTETRPTGTQPTGTQPTGTQPTRNSPSGD